MTENSTNTEMKNSLTYTLGEPKLSSSKQVFNTYIPQKYCTLTTAVPSNLLLAQLCALAVALHGFN